MWARIGYWLGTGSTKGPPNKEIYLKIAQMCVRGELRNITELFKKFC